VFVADILSCIYTPIRSCGSSCFHLYSMFSLCLSFSLILDLNVEAIEKAAEKAVSEAVSKLTRAHISAPLSSPSVYARRILQHFGIDNMADIPLIDGIGDEIVTIPEGRIENEYHLNSLFYPELSNIFGDARLFNTERFGYLPASDSVKNDKKPDWLIFECASLLEMKNKPPTFARDDVRYATPPEDVLEFVTAVMEAKLGTGSLNLTQLETLFTYLALLLKSNHPNPRGVLYNQTEFVYAEYSSEQGGLSAIARSEWSCRGCRGFLQLKFEPPPVLSALLKCVPNNLKLGRFLGKGRFGCVIEVSDEEENKSYALKFVTSNFDLFEDEFGKLCRAHTAAPDVVICPVRESHVRHGEELFAYYLMREIGNPRVKDLFIRQTFQLLHSLHQLNIVHGDPRLENIVEVGDCLKWVDMRDMGACSAYAIRLDMLCLMRSCFGCSIEKIEDSPAVNRRLNVYCDGVSFENVNELYEQCKQSL